MPAKAADSLGLEPLHFKGHYDFVFAGIGFGQADIAVDEKTGGYDMVSDIATTGLARVFVKHQSHTTANANGGAVAYESNYQTRNKKKHVTMTFQDGAIVSEQFEPTDTRPPIDPSLKQGAVDPLTFLVKMREALATARAQGKNQFSLKIYDGKRLTRANFNVKGSQKMRLNGKEQMMVLVDVKRELLGGFSDKELRESKKDTVLHVYFTDDKKLLPVRFEASMMLGLVSATLAN